MYLHSFFFFFFGTNYFFTLKKYLEISVSNFYNQKLQCLFLIARHSVQVERHTLRLHIKELGVKKVTKLIKIVTIAFPTAP